jgi:hypothetical protein
LAVPPVMMAVAPFGNFQALSPLLLLLLAVVDG